MAKVVVAQPIDEAGIEMLSTAGHQVVRLSAHDPEALAAAIADADGLLVRDARVTRDVLAAGKKLKVVSRHGAGLDRIDVGAATELGIVVTYTPEANSASVAEHVMAMILALAKNLLVVDPETRRGNFDIRHKRYGFELAGRTLGILGLGNVGRRLARIAVHGFGMKVIGFDPFVDAPGVTRFEDWRDVLRQADIVSLHVPLIPATRGMIDFNALGLMRPKAILINCARGEVVREADLVRALQEGVIAAAGVDVYDPDPPAADHPYYAFPNIVVTPHSAAHTDEAMRNMATQAAQGIVEVLGG